MNKLLSELLSSFEHAAVEMDGKTPRDETQFSSLSITKLVFDSRDVTAGSLFFALPGTHTDGNIFIPAAIEKGAVAIVFQGDFDIETTQLIYTACKKRGSDSVIAFLKVTSSRFVMSPISSAFYDNPSKHLIVFGVTGTEGKSSTVSFIWQLLRLCGKKAGFISTVQYSLGGDAVSNPQHQTTPEAPIVQEELYEMWKNGCSYAVVESSSHGLSQKLNRLGNVLFDCSIFMNVTLEHLEFHKTFEQYRNDKANLFRALDTHDHIKILTDENRKYDDIPGTVLPNGIEIHPCGIVNLEDPSATFFISATKKPVVGFTTEGKAGKIAAETGANAKPLPQIPADIPYFMARNIAAARYGLSFSILSAEDPAILAKEHHIIRIKAQLPGAFNAYNIMAALIAVSRMTGVPAEKVAEKVEQLIPVKGRMTVIDKGQPFEVIVDYAHTPSSFETIFPPIRNRCTGRMICLFGSGGERDTEKRPLQGEVAAHFCDILFLSDEDPRGENSMDILEQIAAGARKCGKIDNENMFLIPNRKQAIRQAFHLAKKNDIVLLLGKSHENSIIYSNITMPYDEIAEAEQALAELEEK